MTELTCHMCGHAGEDVHEYKYIGIPVAFIECDCLKDCFDREVQRRIEQREVVKPPDYPCIGDGYRCPDYDSFGPTSCKKNRATCGLLSEYRKTKSTEK